MKFLAPLLISFMTINAHAFTLNNSAKLVFSQDEVTVNVAGGFCNNIGISDTEFLSIVGDAVDQFWNKAPTSRLKLRQGQIVNLATAYHTDLICTAGTNCTPNPAIAVASDILVTCNNNTTNFSSSSILGVTIPNNISGNTILGSIVMINDTAATQFDTKSRAEKVAIIAHELGHAFGLGHSPVEDSLMYYATVTSRVALGADDISGISYLYPKQQPISGCGTVDMSGKGPSTWPGLFIGFSIIGLAELFRKKKVKLYT
ncbi:MAG: matrixin family metalloprotease [Rhizobacter sp.]|nr:matrixin family metalloprotease [Bacteriovorax sp.]